MQITIPIQISTSKKLSTFTYSVFLHEADKLKYAESHPRVLYFGKNVAWLVIVLYTSTISTQIKTQIWERNTIVLNILYIFCPHRMEVWVQKKSTVSDFVWFSPGGYFGSKPVWAGDMKQEESGAENWEEKRGIILAHLNENAKFVKKTKPNQNKAQKYKNKKVPKSGEKYKFILRDYPLSCLDPWFCRRLRNSQLWKSITWEGWQPRWHGYLAVCRANQLMHSQCRFLKSQRSLVPFEPATKMSRILQK